MRRMLLLPCLVALGAVPATAELLYKNPQFVTGAQPESAVAADFDLDGRLDLAVRSSNGMVDVFLGNGDAPSGRHRPSGTAAPRSRPETSTVTAFPTWRSGAAAPSQPIPDTETGRSTPAKRP